LGKVKQVESLQVSLFPVTWSPTTCLPVDTLDIKVTASGTLTSVLDARTGSLTLQVPLTPYNTPKKFVTVYYTLQVQSFTKKMSFVVEVTSETNLPIDFNLAAPVSGYWNQI